jgi:phosphate transport system substrate-binding protein
MTSVLLVNLAGKVVAPEASAFQAAAANADWSKAPGYYLVLVDQAGAASWPITGASFILVHATPKDPIAVGSALTFFAWAYASGGDMAAALDYVPLPPAVVKQVEATWVSSITSGGKPVWTGK